MMLAALAFRRCDREVAVADADKIVRDRRVDLAFADVTRSQTESASERKVGQRTVDHGTLARSKVPISICTPKAPTTWDSSFHPTCTLISRIPSFDTHVLVRAIDFHCQYRVARAARPGAGERTAVT